MFKNLTGPAKWAIGAVTTLLIFGFFGHPICHFLTELVANVDKLVPGHQ